MSRLSFVQSLLFGCWTRVHRYATVVMMSCRDRLQANKAFATIVWNCSFISLLSLGASERGNLTNAAKLDPKVKKVINLVHTYWAMVIRKDKTIQIPEFCANSSTKVTDVSRNVLIYLRAPIIIDPTF